MADLFVHVGLPKSGTTSIQTALTAHAADLAAAGVLFPGGRHLAQRRAVQDLLGHRMGGESEGVIDGAFGRLAAEMRDFTGPTILLSDESLTRARPRHVRRFADAVAMHRLFVVVTTRDLARLLRSAWQQSVVMGSEVGWPDFMASVREPDRAGPSQAAAFWVKHDLGRALDVWGTVVPRDRILLVTAPPDGAPESLLLERFGEAVGVPSTLWARGARARNVGLGVVETEVIRRLNGRLGSALAMLAYRRTIEEGIRPRWRPEHPRPLSMVGADLAWARERALLMVAHLEARGHPVVGDLADLVPPEPPLVSSPPSDIAPAELLASTEEALAALAVSYGRLSTRHRRLVDGAANPPPRGSVVVRGVVRAGIFRFRQTALRHADRVPPLAWALRRRARPAHWRT